MRTRQEIRSAAAPWSSPPLLWYARGVGVLQKRPISDKTSWLFLAAMHGIDPDVWAQFGFLSYGCVLFPRIRKIRRIGTSASIRPGTSGRGIAPIFGPSRTSSAQRSSPGGPADWGLPYWNYSDTKTSGATAIPKEFTDQTMPDGSPNPLFVEARFGQGVPARDAALNRSIIFGTFVGNDADWRPLALEGRARPSRTEARAAVLWRTFPITSFMSMSAARAALSASG